MSIILRLTTASVIIALASPMPSAASDWVEEDDIASPVHEEAPVPTKRPVPTPNIPARLTALELQVFAQTHSKDPPVVRLRRLEQKLFPGRVPQGNLIDRISCLNTAVQSTFPQRSLYRAEVASQTGPIGTVKKLLRPLSFTRRSTNKLYSASRNQTSSN